jgi:hypothetical protein
MVEYYIKQIMDRHFEGYTKYPSRFNFRCNVCGDSQKSSKKKRGNIVKSKKSGIWYYTCYNCFAMYPKVEKWMKEYFPEEYNQLKKDTFLKTDTKLTNKENENEIKKDIQEIYFKPILSDSLLKQTAIKFCRDRRIPESYWSKFYVCSQEKYANRLIIPFYNKLGKIYFYQARILPGFDDFGNKYISRFGRKKSFNIYNIDNTKEVIIVEGPIDSMFIQNSIALVGLDIEREELNTIDKKYWMLDNDKQGRKATIKLLEKGQYVFNWKKYLSENNIISDGKIDINDLYIKLDKKEPFQFSDFKLYFTNRLSDKIYFMEQ